MRVLRLGPGAEIEVFDGRGAAHRAVVRSIASQRVTVALTGDAPVAAEPVVRVTLAAAVLKGDKMDHVVRDATMMGVAVIQPLLTARTEVSAAAVRRGHRRERWHGSPCRPSSSAAGVVPRLEDAVTVDEWTPSPDNGATLVLVEPAAGGWPVDVPPVAAVTLVSGPRGWTPDELDALAQAGARPIALGPRTLRADAVRSPPWRRCSRRGGGRSAACEKLEGRKGTMRRIVMVGLALACVTGLGVRAQDPVATFSILGYDPATGEVGGAVQSRVFSVGNGVLWAEAGVGAAATQAIVDVSYGPKALALLRAGMRPEAVIKAVWDSDPDPEPERWTREGRQFAVGDAGRTAVYTTGGVDLGRAQAGALCHRPGQHPRRRGGERQVTAARADQAPVGRPWRPSAGQQAGGDTRGMQSAAISSSARGGCGSTTTSSCGCRWMTAPNPSRNCDASWTAGTSAPRASSDRWGDDRVARAGSSQLEGQPHHRPTILVSRSATPPGAERGSYRRGLGGVEAAGDQGAASATIDAASRPWSAACRPSGWRARRRRRRAARSGSRPR